MARLSKEERAELEARLADDSDDDDDEVELKFSDGSAFRGSYRRAQQVADARGFKLKADPPADDDAPKPDKRFTSGRRTG
jgi:hypothetical protein